MHSFQPTNQPVLGERCNVFHNQKLRKEVQSFEGDGEKAIFLYLTLFKTGRGFVTRSQIPQTPPTPR